VWGSAAGGEIPPKQTFRNQEGKKHRRPALVVTAEGTVSSSVQFIVLSLFSFLNPIKALTVFLETAFKVLL